MYNYDWRDSTLWIIELCTDEKKNGTAGLWNLKKKKNCTMMWIYPLIIRIRFHDICKYNFSSFVSRYTVKVCFFIFSVYKNDFT